MDVDGLMITPPRRFVMVRDHDPTGVSGTGVIMEGVQLSNGSVYGLWLTETASEIRHTCVENLVAIHGHGGSTRLVWLDAA